MMIAIGCDHAAFELKEKLIAYLVASGYQILDCGCFDTNSVDYPLIAAQTAKVVAEGNCERGILICGTGIGMSIAANKIKGIRAAVCYDKFCTQMCREHNDANVLCLGARVIDEKTALTLADIFLSTPFSSEQRHKIRVDEINALDK